MPPAGEITGSDAGRQARVLEPVDGLLADEMIVAAVFELQPDEAQREDGVGADELQAGRAGDRDLDRDRDVALDLLRRLAGLLGDDLDDRRRRIGIGLDVQGRKGNAEADDEKGHERDHHQQPPGGERDQTTQHRWPRTAGAGATHCQRRSPRARPPVLRSSTPLRICVKPSCWIPIDHAALEQPGSVSTQTVATSPRGSPASVGTAGPADPSSMLILNIANISALSRPSALSISAADHDTRRVSRSEAELMALMRALKILSGTAEPGLDIPADTYLRDILLEDLGLQPHRREIGDRIEPVARIGLGHAVRVQPCGNDGAVDRRRDRGHAAEPAGLLEFQDFLHRQRPRIRPDATRLRTPRPPDRRSFSAAGELRLGLLQILGRRGLAFMQTANATLRICASQLREPALRFAACAAMKVVLLGELLGLSISSSGSPLLTRSPSLAIKRVTRPEWRQNDRAGIPLYPI